MLRPKLTEFTEKNEKHMQIQNEQKNTGVL